MIKIIFRNGDFVTWNEGEYTDYKYDGKCFVVIKNEQWIGIYNIDTISSITVGR